MKAVEFTCPKCGAVLTVSLNVYGPSIHAPAGSASLSRYDCQTCKKEVPYIETFQRPKR